MTCSAHVLLLALPAIAAAQSNGSAGPEQSPGPELEAASSIAIRVPLLPGSLRPLAHARGSESHLSEAARPVSIPSRDREGAVPVSSPSSNLSWKLSLAALIASQAADLQSSFGLVELNPVLGRGPFGPSQAIRKSIATAAIAGAEIAIVRRWPSSARVLRWFNFGGAAVGGAVAIHNYRIGGGR